MFVQIERGVSLLVLKYSRTYPQSPIPAPWCVCMCVCETQNAGTDPRIPTLRGGNFNKTSYNRPLGDIAGCKALKSDVRRGPMMQKLLSGTLDHREFLRVKNRNDGSPGENTPGSPPGQHTRSPRVRAGGGRARPVRVTMGRRCIDRGRPHVKTCEGCYARMVREWNGRAGVM